MAGRSLGIYTDDPTKYVRETKPGAGTDAGPCAAIKSDIDMATKTTKLGTARKEYQRLKLRYPDSIVLFRMGAFYEAFFEDAKLCSDVCRLPMFSRMKEGVAVPFVDIPLWEFDKYLQRMLQAGYRVMVCEPVGNREVMRTMTPGTVNQDAAADKQST